VLQDIAVLTCGKAVTEGASLRLQDIQISDLGHAEKITIDKNNTVVEGKSMFDQLVF
jgi:chaperonin GroEL